MLRPLLICNLPDGWMFSAWCELRKDFRTFRIDRIHSLTVMDQIFSDDPEKNVAAFRKQDDHI
ncbi:MAG: WYL domain-containing protein [Pseudomonadota bacterium]